MTTDTVEETALRPVASAMRVFTHQHGRQPKTWEEIGSYVGLECFHWQARAEQPEAARLTTSRASASSAARRGRTARRHLCGTL